LAGNKVKRMISIARDVIVAAVQELEVKDHKEYSNIVGNAMKGHGQFALKVLMNNNKFFLSEDQIYDELWVLFEEGKITEEKHAQFINDMRYNRFAKEMLSRYLRKSRRIVIK